jgi:hypothetical protein
MNPIQVEVVFPLINTIEFGCKNCALIFDRTGIPQQHRMASSEEFPKEWKTDIARLHEWISNATELYRHRIRIRLIDAQSPLGIWKQVRHRLFKLPAFVVDKQAVHMGWDTGRLEAIIDDRIRKESVRLAER